MLFFYLYNAIIPLTRQIVNYILHFIRNIGLMRERTGGETIGALPQTPAGNIVPCTLSSLSLRDKGTQIDAAHNAKMV